MIRLLLGALLACLLSACGGGADEAHDRAAASADGLRQRMQAAVRQQGEPASPRQSMAPSTEQAVDQLLDFAEARFPEFFPSHAVSQVSAPFRYRFYPQTGVYLGVAVQPGMGYELEGVYALGGAFGSKPVYIGALAALSDFDGDGVVNSEDAAPLDALCSAAQDAQAGECLLRVLAGSRLRLLGSGGGMLYFSAEADALTLHAYDLRSRHFTARAVMSGFTPTAYAYSLDHGRIYVGDSDGNVHAYSEALVPQTAVFARLSGRVSLLLAAGKYLVAQSGNSGSYRVFDRQGVQTQADQGYGVTANIEWNAASNRLYHFRDGVSPNDLLYEVIDPATGRISASGETPYHGDYQIRGPIRANPAGTKVLLGTGDLYAAPALTWAGKIPEDNIADALWLANDEVLVASAGGSAGTIRLRRYSAQRVLIEDIASPGELIALLRDGSSNVLLAKTGGMLDIRSYTANNDVDGDGVPNTDDKFPLDKTAALDSDGDGYPDAFFPGYGPADSPTGLTLDAYPLDPSCHAPGQGNGSQCDPALYTPSFVPERVVADGQGQYLLFKRSQDRIYRWSGATGQFVAPLQVGVLGSTGVKLLPRVMSYAADQRRLYLGYETGQITMIDFASSSVTEKPFATVSTAVGGLAAAGKFLLAQDYSGAWSTHYVFNQSGVLTDSRDWNYYSSHYDWSPQQSRVYFFRSSMSPDDLQYEEIAQDSGKIKSDGETPYHGDYVIQGPIRVSQAGGRIALGSGDIYSSTDLTVVASLKVSWVDMQWLADGRLVTLATNAASARVSTYSSSLTLVRDQVIAGTPVALVLAGSGVVAFTQVDGRLQATRLTP